MRTLNPSFALASVFGFLMAASCTLITDVDRTKIPTDAGPQGGETATGGTGGKGGSSGKGGSGGAMGGSSGTATGGSGGQSPACSHAEGTITLEPGVLFADGDSFSIGDGLSDPVVFEMDFQGSAAVGTEHVAIPFTGEPSNVDFANKLADAINDQGDNLRVAAETANVAMAVTGSGGEAGSGGEGGNGTSGASQGGAPNAGAGGGPVTPGTIRIELSNEFAGALGNVKIVKKAGNPHVKVSGMSNGKSVACAAASICTSDAECASDDCGSDNICVE